MPHEYKIAARILQKVLIKGLFYIRITELKILTVKRILQRIRSNRHLPILRCIHVAQLRKAGCLIVERPQHQGIVGEVEHVSRLAPHIYRWVDIETIKRSINDRFVLKYCRIAIFINISDCLIQLQAPVGLYPWLA